MLVVMILEVRSSIPHVRAESEASRPPAVRPEVNFPHPRPQATASLRSRRLRFAQMSNPKHRKIDRLFSLQRTWLGFRAR